MTTQTMTPDLCAPAGAKTDPATLRRAITASALGNATDWLEYGIYAYGVTYISAALFPGDTDEAVLRSEEHTSELQSLKSISYAVFCFKKKQQDNDNRAILRYN